MEHRSLLLRSQGPKNGPNSEPVWAQSTFPPPPPQINYYRPIVPPGIVSH